MNQQYVPLLQTQRDLHDLPRGMARFRKYLETIGTTTGEPLELPPLIAMNPMGREHVNALLDDYLALDADGIGAQAAAEAAAALAEVPGDFKATLVIADDLKGGWTNRFATEYSHRFPPAPRPDQPMPWWAKDRWIVGLLWSSEPASAQAAREALLTAAYRTAYLQRHGSPRSLRDMMAQEGYVMARAGCTAPTLDPEDRDYTRVVLEPFLDATDMRTAIECLFGDGPGRTLNFTPRGLSPWAGLALALHDARGRLPA